MPIQFCPSDKPDAYIYKHVSSKFKESELIDNICEFRLIDGKWDPVRIRHDRKIDYDSGIYFGNNYKVAEDIWMNYKNPLTLTDLTVSQSEYINNSYFKEQKSTVHRNHVAYNSYVKDKLISRFKNKEWALSLASGKGQDMFRLSKYGIKNCLFMDIDQQALSQIIMKKHSFQKKLSKFNTRVLTKQMDLKTDVNIIIKSISSLVPVGNIDLVLFNFAIHYFTDTLKSLRNVLSLISKCLSDGGSCIITCYDGQKIIDLLNDKDQWNDYEGDVLKYSIKKMYKNESLNNVGQKIGVLLPFSKSEYYEEFLVNADFLISEAKKFGLELTETFRFCKFLKDYHNIKRLNDSDIHYVQLHRYFIFTKKIKT